MRHLHLNELSLICDMCLNKITYFLYSGSRTVHLVGFCDLSLFVEIGNMLNDTSK